MSPPPEPATSASTSGLLAAGSEASSQRNAASRREAAYFDNFIAENGDFNPFTEHGWRVLARRFEQFVDQKQPFDLLDVGCGTGQSRQVYARGSRTYVGIDLAEQAIRRAQEKFPASSWQVADATRLPFADASFDVVAFSSVLHHIPDYGQALREAVRVLRPGGQAFAYDPNLLHPGMALLRWPRSPMYCASGVSPNERPLLPASVRSAFAQAGFVDLRQRAESDVPFQFGHSGSLKALIPPGNFSGWLMEKIGVGRWFGVFIVTCGRKPAASVGKMQ